MLILNIVEDSFTIHLVLGAGCHASGIVLLLLHSMLINNMIKSTGNKFENNRNAL